MSHKQQYDIVYIECLVSLVASSSLVAGGLKMEGDTAIHDVGSGGVGLDEMDEDQQTSSSPASL